MNKDNTFNLDDKEKARRRLKYFENFLRLREDQQEELALILNTYPDLKYVM